MKVCYFGIYDPEYSRNRVLSMGLKQNGCEVIECRVDPGIGTLKKFRLLYEEFKKIQDNDIDFVVVGFPGHSVVWLAQILFPCPVILDAFVSLYNSEINDRQNHYYISLYALYYYFLDWVAVRVADFVLLDTQAHIHYFLENVYNKKEKYSRVFVGSDPDIMYPADEGNEGDDFLVHFHGSYIPLQGVQYILKAAELLRDEKSITFSIIGKGDEADVVRKYRESMVIDNVTFEQRIPYNILSQRIRAADLCLGIFGDTQKTDLVIPNKVFEALACKKPVVTADTPAARELLRHKESAYLVQKASPESIKDAIMELRNDKKLRDRMAANGYSLFCEMLMPKQIVSELLHTLEEKYGK